MIDISNCPRGIEMQGVAFEVATKSMDKLDKIEQIVNKWNNDASHSFSDMCKINGILKE